MIECLTPWYLVFNLFAAHNCAEIYTSLPPSDLVSIQEYLPYFLKTIILELPFYYFFLKKSQSVVKIFTTNLVLNLATHPFIFLILPLLLYKFDANYLQYLITAEVFAPTVEALILYQYYKLSLNRAFMAAIIANLFSWSIGVYWL